MLASEIGLKLATYTLRDPASDKLRILMAAEIDRSGNPDGRLALAYSLVDDKGRLIRQPDRSRGEDAGLAGDRDPDVLRLHPQRRDRHAHAQDRRRRRARPARQRRALVPRRADPGRPGARDRSADRRRPHDLRQRRADRGRRVHVGHGERLHRALLRRGRRPEEHDRDVRGRAGRAGDARSTAPPVECSRRPPTRRIAERSKGRSRSRSCRRATTSCAPWSAPTDGRSARSRARFVSAGRSRPARRSRRPARDWLRARPGTDHPHVTHRTLRPRVGPHAAGRRLLRREAERRRTRRVEPRAHRRARARRPLRRSRQGAEHRRDHPCRRPF